jgi:hypothetical protein
LDEILSEHIVITMFTQNAPKSTILDSAQNPPSPQSTPESASKYVKKAHFSPKIHDLREEFTDSPSKLSAFIPLLSAVIPSGFAVMPHLSVFMPDLLDKN